MTTTEFHCRYERDDHMEVYRETGGDIALDIWNSSADFTSIHLGADDARRLADAIAPRPAVDVSPAKAVEPGRVDRDPITSDTENGDKLREAADTIGDAFWWDYTAEGLAFWSNLHDRLNALAKMADAKAAEREAAAKVVPFLAPCPAGFGTVLGHLAQQGKSTADHGVAEGRRLAGIAKREGVAETWVRAPEALRDVCDRVRSYPADFLARNLGPVPEGVVKLAA